ncbi:MAG: hypothetical protein ACHRXM_25510 [Isosphaerales bacterium]
MAIHDVVQPLDQRRRDGPDQVRPHLVHHVGEGHAAIRVGDHQRAARAAPEIEPAFREEGQHLQHGEQAVTDAQLERYAQHEVDPVALHFEDPVDRLRREQRNAWMWRGGM